MDLNGKVAVIYGAGGAIGGTLSTTIAFSTASAPVVDAQAQSVRAGLVNQYNVTMQNITSTQSKASSTSEVGRPTTIVSSGPREWLPTTR